MLKLYPPGTRKKNRYYIAKGYVAGREYEFVCRDPEGRKTANRRFAEEFVRKAEKKLKAEAPKLERRSPVKTFGEVADAYAAARGISRNDARYLEKLKKAWIESEELPLQDIAIGDVLPMHIATAANALYAHCTNETRNRQAYAPAAAVLHFAADNRLRDYLVIKKLPEKEPESRRPAPGVAKLLLANTSGDQQLLLKFLFYQGWRITESLTTREDKVDLEARTVAFWIPKARRWKAIHLHEEVVKALAGHLPVGRPDGRIFPWRDRHQVYDWLGPLCEKLGIEFTPHMARHEFGSALRELGAHPRDIADAGSWTSEKSTMRYSQAPERARGLMRQLRVDAKSPRKTRGKTRGN